MSINDDTSSLTTVSYGGSVLAKLDNGQTAAIRCARKRMKADIIVTAGTGSGGAGKRLSTNAFAATLVVGSSNAEESYNDYALTILGDLTVVGARYANIAYTTEGCVYNTIKTFVNNTENDITVNEVGLYQHFSENFDVLLYRKKLDKPVTLKALGGTATFNLVIDIPYANKP